MTRAEFNKWIDSVSATAPFTLADAKELYTIIKNYLPNALVEVYCTRGDLVHVRVDDVRRDLEIR